MDERCDDYHVDEQVGMQRLRGELNVREEVLSRGWVRPITVSSKSVGMVKGEIERSLVLGRGDSEKEGFGKGNSVVKGIKV
jgi:hypothetical protein